MVDSCLKAHTNQISLSCPGRMSFWICLSRVCILQNGISISVEALLPNKETNITLANILSVTICLQKRPYCNFMLFCKITILPILVTELPMVLLRGHGSYLQGCVWNNTQCVNIWILEGWDFISSYWALEISAFDWQWTYSRQHYRAIKMPPTAWGQSYDYVAVLQSRIIRAKYYWHWRAPCTVLAAQCQHPWS